MNNGSLVPKKLKQVSLTVEERLKESEIIFQDLKDNFASRLDEAVPALNVSGRKFETDRSRNGCRRYSFAEGTLRLN